MMRKKQAGFTLMETMVALVVLLAVSAVVMSGMMQMMKTEGTITNRTAMHTSVRAATELLQQEIGQAGKIVSVSGQMTTPVVGLAISPDTPITANVTFANMNDASGNGVLFEGAWVTVDNGLPRETVQLKCLAGIGACPIGTNDWQATFTWAHGGPGVVVPASLQGSFSSGIVPPAVPADPGALTNIPVGYAGYPFFPAGPPVYPYPNLSTKGSNGRVLKLFGDVNGDGNMVYAEYTCVQGTAQAPGFVYRNQVPWTWAAPMPPLDPSKIVLANVLANPNDANGNPVPCFKYQLQTAGGANAAALDYAFVTDVAVTLTVQTQNPDPQVPLINGRPNYQTETKALLNVSPRNVYDAYLSGTFSYKNRIQPMPLNLKGVLLPTDPD
ncbi:MAG TPA: prepilin-type N-terminal cleavage/methylation domain-containing protein [Candidatus Acidoferrum sp.]|nr:prepilin-type N-terminal cleavage/methylation domain-containing protein [Candidatus Acidoferrum sp.]